MRVDRISGKIKDFYYITTVKGDTMTLVPSVPNNFLSKEKVGDWHTKRIKLYDNIGDALSGIFLGENLEGATLYVYRAMGIGNESLIKPGLSSVPYSNVIQEWWYLKPVRLDYRGTIYIEKELKPDIYHYGHRSSTGLARRWDWIEVLKKWQKPKFK